DPGGGSRRRHGTEHLAVLESGRHDPRDPRHRARAGDPEGSARPGEGREAEEVGAPCAPRCTTRTTTCGSWTSRSHESDLERSWSRSMPAASAAPTSWSGTGSRRRRSSCDVGGPIGPLAGVSRGQRLAGLRPGHTIVVIGSGVAGLLHVKLAKASGAAKVIATDIVEYRKAAARKAGADAVIDGREDVPA